jgi:hypothetical protein
MGAASQTATTANYQVERASEVRERPRTKSGFIIGPVIDSLFIIGAPLMGVALAFPLFLLPKETCTTSLLGRPVDLREAFLFSFISAHLVLVFFRSHANPKIFWTHPLRFTVVPLTLLVAAASSIWIASLAGVLVVWWDVYHSSLQTFGFGRIYDAKQGNNPNAGRTLDIGMNLFLYLGPVLAGAQFARHVGVSTEHFAFLEPTESPWRQLVLQQAPDFLLGNQRYLTIAVLATGIPFLVYYVSSYWRLYRQGYKVSFQKVSLMVITGCVSTYFWGFRSFMDAFWVMNFFHALQYFTIVFYSEGGNLARLFRVDRLAYGAAMAFAWIVGLTFVYGFWANMCAAGTWLTSAVLTVALMHFWYDSFIWSVKKKQV